MGTNICSTLRRTTSRAVVLFGLALLAIALTPPRALGQGGANNCLADVSSANSCTAGDVSVAAVQAGSVVVFAGGPAGTDKCFAGQPFSFTADFEIKTTSQKARSNIGIFFGTGQANALHGTCTNAILSPQHSCAGGTATCGDPDYEELDQSINGEPACGANGSPSPCGCGDTSKSDVDSVFGASTQRATLEVDNVTCPSSGASITLPVCSSWYQPASNMPECLSPAPNYPWVAAAIPGAPSKCTCGSLTIPVQPIQPAIGVTKNCNIPPDTTAGLTSCDAGPEGQTVKYTVTITNSTPSGEGGVIVDQICDNRYGTVYDDGSGLPACPAGTVGSIISGSASSCGSLGTISSSASCTFEVNHGENLSVTDTVSVSGHSSVSSTAKFGPSTSNTVTVTSEDAPTTAKTSLGYPASPVQAACVTVAYNVTAANTSAADESVTLTQVGTAGTVGYVSALMDGHFGDITTTHGNASTDGSVTATTCGTAATTVLQPGTGTPPTTNGGTYTCTFNGVICGAPGPIASPSCAAGFQITDTGVTPNLTGDDPGDKITTTISPFTSTICLIPE